MDTNDIAKHTSKVSTPEVPSAAATEIKPIIKNKMLTIRYIGKERLLYVTDAK